MTIWNCELCDSTDVPVFKDTDMDMWLCEFDFESFNGTIETIELNEVF